MNLDITEWKEFMLGRLFSIKYGVNLELNACDETEDKSAASVNFVSRTAENNGVSSRVMAIDGIEPQKAGLISIAGGGSVLSTFLQEEPFYSGRDLYTLEAKEDIPDEAKLFVITIIEQNKYKYSYGRQANKTMPYLELLLPIQHNPDGTPVIDNECIYSDEGYVPDWQWMEEYMKSLHHKPLTTKNKVGQSPKLNVSDWEYFLLKNICSITMGNKMDYSAMSMDEPVVNFVGRSADNNGVAGKVDLVMDDAGNVVEPYKAGCVTVALGGSLGSTYLQVEDFYTSQNVSVLEFESCVSDYAKIFVTTCIMNECKYKYFPFGRELNTHIRTDFGFILPIQRNLDGTPVIDDTHKYSDDGYVPDWQFMEDYVKALPYGDRL